MKKCPCWVASRPEEERFSLHYGAHSASWPQYRPSLDPVDRAHDDDARREGERIQQAGVDGRLFYVSVIDREGGRKGILLGPYETHQEALDNVRRGRNLACDADGRAHWYGFGTCSAPRERPLSTVFPLAVSESRNRR